MLDLLQTFCCVADVGSLNRAAEVLHLTQPAVTRQIKLLESKLGVVLLIRTAQGVNLTPAGEAVLKHARQAVSAVAACEGAAAALAETAQEKLRLSAGLHVTMYWLPDLLARFQERWPATRVELRPVPHRAALQRLLQYEVDIALIGHEISVPGVREIPLFPDPFVLISQPGAAADPLRVSDLQGATLLLLPPTATHRREIDDVLERYAVECAVIEFPGAEAIKMAVGLGMGSAIIPRSAVRGEAADGKLVVREFLDWPGRERMVRAVVRAEGSLPAPVQVFLQIARQKRTP